jgi:predicted TIM-barrel fold metal-dependent hydrolase
MIVDCHTHIWRREHLSEGFFAAAIGALARGKLETVLPDRHFRALQGVDHAIVTGWRSQYLNVDVPNQFIADYCHQHAEKLIGFACVDPFEPDPLGELKRSVEKHGLKGVYLAPVYQNFHPVHTDAMPIYEAAQEMRLPILLDLGVAYPGVASLKYAAPFMLEELGDRFADLKILIGHLGSPWVEQTAILLSKYPSIYAEISGLAARPWHFYQALVACFEHGVLDKLLFASNYPFGLAEKTIEALYQVNLIAQGTNLPKIPRDLLRGIVERDAVALLGLDQPQGARTT